MAAVGITYEPLLLLLLLLFLLLLLLFLPLLCETRVLAKQYWQKQQNHPTLLRLLLLKQFCREQLQSI